MEKSNSEIKDREIIVSLTSFPEALEGAAIAIKSILNNDVKPDKIVLYLTTSQFPGKKLPSFITDLIDNEKNFEVRFHDAQIRSYTKLIPALQDFPDSIIITIDDDIIYHPKLIGKLLKWHRQYPKDIIANRVRKIYPDRPYSQWKKYHWYDFIFKKYKGGYLNLLTGVGGVLYPPGALKSELLNKELYYNIAPTADDIWFWACAVANQTKITPLPFGNLKKKDIAKPKELSLKWHNFEGGTDRNKEIFDSILERFPDLKEKLQAPCVST